MRPVDPVTFRASVERLAVRPGDDVELVGPLLQFLSQWLTKKVLDGSVERSRYASASGLRSDCQTGQVTVFTLRADRSVRVEIGRYGVVAAYVAKAAVPGLLSAVCDPHNKQWQTTNHDPLSYAQPVLCDPASAGRL